MRQQEHSRPTEFAEHLQPFIRGRMISFDILVNPSAVFEEEWAAAVESTNFLNQISQIEQLAHSLSEQKNPNEQQTRQDLIYPILEALEWPEFLVEQNLSLGPQQIIPDLLLFSRQHEKDEASKISSEAMRYAKGICIGELKRWNTNLDRHSGSVASPTSQMLHYLRRNQDVNEGHGAQWGLLTDGRKWRVYYARAQSVSEDYLEIDLGALFFPNERALSVFDAVGMDEIRAHILGLFVFFFANRAFSNEPAVSRHLRGIAAGRHFESRVTERMGEEIFNTIFPRITLEIARQNPDAQAEQIRHESLMFLFRLLFILYAEDRGLLPMHNTSYRFHRSFRRKIREHMSDLRSLSLNPISDSSAYWTHYISLCRDISRGNKELGLPAYNGDLFDLSQTPLLNKISLDDVTMVAIVEPLSFQDGKYINYRTLNVQHLGAIYERLLARRVVVNDGAAIVVADPGARKESGSYYTPDGIVRLTVEKTLSPLLEKIYKKYEDQLKLVTHENGDFALEDHDPAFCILNLRVCDPAMGSAHFLVDTVDWLSDRLIEALARCADEIPGYESPIFKRITEIRESISHRAESEGWRIVPEQLDDRQIVKRMVLKKCIYGVDLNPMAVELAKLSLWLHTFTVGAPLSFLNHHLKCGNSIFGSWIGEVTERFDQNLFQLDLSRVLRANAKNMQAIEDLPDASLEEVRQSAEFFDRLTESASLVKNFLDINLGLTWLRPTGQHTIRGLKLPWLLENASKVEITKAQQCFDVQVAAWCDGQFGDPLTEPQTESPMRELWVQARNLANEHQFFHWEVAFPGVWNHERSGFDAIVGNPPWERIKFEEAEWLAYCKPTLARNMTTAERDRELQNLLQSGDQQIMEFYEAKAKAEHTMDMVRQSRHYHLLSSGDINIYGLFAERSLSLLNKHGNSGLVLMAGIAADRSSAPFFQRVTRQGRLRNFYHCENRKTAGGKHFADVHAQLKFCVFVASSEPNGDQTHYGCFVDDVKNVDDETKCFNLAIDFFDKVNPNTGTLPILRTKRDRAILTKIYDKVPILHLYERSTVLFNVRFCRMFDMTNDRKAGKMRSREQLQQEEEAWQSDRNTYESATGSWLPLYEGKMIWQFDHRSADVRFNPKAPLKRASSRYLSDEEHQINSRTVIPQYWMSEKEVEDRFTQLAKLVSRNRKNTPPSDLVNRLKTPFFLGFRDITNTTDRRTMISALIPFSAVSNTLCLLLSEYDTEQEYARNCAFLLGNFGSLIFDYVARCKLHANHMNWYILEQMPVIPPERYDQMKFGTKTAAEVVQETVLELVYTAHDLAPFATALNYTDENNRVRPPFSWDPHRRRMLRAKLDAVYFHLYGVTETVDIDYIQTMFRLDEQVERKQFGSFQSQQLRHAWVNALTAGQPDATIPEIMTQPQGG